MRSARVVVGLLALALSAGTTAREVEVAPELRPRLSAYFAAQREALAAYERRDAQAMRAAATRALQAHPQHPPARYLRAAADALGGQGDEALRELGALADLGLVQSPEREPTFATLREDPRFLALAKRFAANAASLGEAQRAVVAKLPGDFIPEGLVRDAARKRWLLSSVRSGRIVSVGDDGKVRAFAGHDTRRGSVLGLALRDDVVLAASAQLAQSRPTAGDALGDAAVLAFALDDGRTLGAWPLAGSGDAPHVFGDVLPIDAHRVLASDAGEGALYLLDTRDGRYERLVHGRAPDVDAFASPQGMARLDARRVVFADWSSGLWILEGAVLTPRSRDASGVRLRRLAHAQTALHGIDGLYRVGARRLVAIQNGTRPHRILAIDLDAARESITRVRVLAQAGREWDEPTLGTVVGEQFCFVANSHWPRFDAQGELPAAETLSPPRIECLALAD